MVRDASISFMSFQRAHGRGPNQVRQRDSQVPETCIPNIGPAERRKRLAAGGIQFAVALAALAFLLAAGADRWWRLVLLIPFWGAAAGFFQWRDKT